MLEYSKEDLRIGIDARITGYREGGISRYGRALAHAFSHMDTTDQFTIFQNWRHRESIVQGKNVSTSYLVTPPHHRWEQWTLPIELTIHKVDLLHSIDFIPPFRRPCASVITVHDLAFVRMPHIMTGESLRYYLQVGKAVKNTDGIIADSQVTKNDIVDLLGVSGRSVDVIHPGLDSAFRPLDNRQVKRFCQEKGIPASFMLWVSTIEPRKNLDVLLKTVALVRGKLPSEKRTLVVAGAQGWLSDHTFAEMSSLQSSGDVVYLGQISQDDLLHLYNAAWLFIFTSLYEGFGLPPLEAMACGTPVISSNSPAMPEVLGDAAMYFTPDDPDTLAEKVLSLSKDESLRRRMSEAGLKQASRYTWEEAARQTLAVYQRAYPERGRKAGA